MDWLSALLFASAQARTLSWQQDSLFQGKRRSRGKLISSQTGGALLPLPKASAYLGPVKQQLPIGQDGAIPMGVPVSHAEGFPAPRGQWAFDGAAGLLFSELSDSFRNEKRSSSRLPEKMPNLLFLDYIYKSNCLMENYNGIF